MSDNGIVWEDPPPQRNGVGRPGVWVDLLTPLMAQPGRWARIREVSSQARAAALATSVRRGAAGHAHSSQRVRVPPGRWEVVSRSVIGDEDPTNKRFFIYVRYLGPEEEA